MTTKNEKDFWIAAIAKSILFIILTILIILLTLELQEKGFSSEKFIFYLFGLFFVTIGYIFLETRINFLIKND